MSRLSDVFEVRRCLDLRSEPEKHAGYRAVHIELMWDDAPVELQVRTSLQHAWAEVYEAFADLYGRGLRYGEPFSHPDKRLEQVVNDLAETLQQISIHRISAIETASELPGGLARRQARTLERKMASVRETLKKIEG